MDMNTLMNETSWKKLALMVIALIATSWVVHEVLFWKFYHEVQQTANQINNQVSQTQKDIQQKLAESDREFNNRSKAFNTRSDDFQKLVEHEQQQITGYIDKMIKEDEEKQAVFDKEFKEAPARMWKQFEETTQAMRNQFERDSQATQEKFQEKQRKLFEQKGK
jgi:hypothetical protein